MTKQAKAFAEIAVQHVRIERALEDLARGRVATCTFEELVELLIDHFRDEELFMRDIAYPHINAHRWAHEAILACVHGLLGEPATQHGSGPELIERLAALVLDHTRNADGELAEYYQSRAVAL